MSDLTFLGTDIWPAIASVRSGGALQPLNRTLCRNIANRMQI
jgi:hypothetical protein